MVFKTLLVVLVIVVLMEDGSSMRKSEEERKEDEDLAKLVNVTLAEEAEKKRKEEEKTKKREIEDETKSKDEGKDEKKKNRTGDGTRKRKEDEASSPFNCTCPIEDPCQEVRDCAPCAPCPVVEPCPEIQECEPCPEVKPCLPCRPCGPCPAANHTSGRPCTPCPVVNMTSGHWDCPSACQEPAIMSVPVAMCVGACVSLLVTGVATTIGLLFRYVPPTISGLLLVAVIILVWYLSSQYPDVARELGGRAVALLREAALALNNRVVEVLQRHREQVGFPV
jgi:hypothetical protein